MTNADETLGAFIRRKRDAAGLSQDALAAKAKLTPATIRNLESGRTKVPQSETLRSLAVALEVKFLELWDLVTDEREARAAR